MSCRPLRCEAYVIPESDFTGENVIQCGAIAFACGDCGDSAGCQPVLGTGAAVLRVASWNPAPLFLFTSLVLRQPFGNQRGVKFAFFVVVTLTDHTVFLFHFTWI